MSTISKLGGKQFAGARQKRKDAIAFYGRLRRTPGIAGVIAAGMWQTLQRIHRDPQLNGPQKEAEFRRLLQMHAKATNPAVPVPTTAPVLAETP